MVQIFEVIETLVGERSGELRRINRDLNDIQVQFRNADSEILSGDGFMQFTVALRETRQQNIGGTTNVPPKCFERRVAE